MGSATLSLLVCHRPDGDPKQPPREPSADLWEDFALRMSERKKPFFVGAVAAASAASTRAIAAATASAASSVTCSVPITKNDQLTLQKMT